MAEGFAKYYNIKYHGNLEIFSRGLMAREGASANKNAIKSMQMYNNDISDHLSHSLKQYEIDDDTLLLAMTKQHVDYINQTFLVDKEKVFTVNGYIGKDIDIDDPFGLPQSEYDACSVTIETAVKEIIKKIIKQQEVENDSNRF